MAVETEANPKFDKLAGELTRERVDRFRLCRDAAAFALDLLTGLDLRQTPLLY